MTAVFEINENKKIVQLTAHCAALFAGNIASANEVLKKVKPRIKESDSIETIAKQVITVCTETYNYAIESQLLSKYGLTLEAFNKQQKELDATFVSTTLQTISRNNLGIEILVVGKDGTTPQILKISAHNNLSDETSIGYACIGSGSSHANLALIESLTHPNMNFNQTLHSVMRAKRKSEYDPHVGEKSDIITIQEDVKFINEGTIKRVFSAYDKSQVAIEAMNLKTSTKLGGMIYGTAARK